MTTKPTYLTLVDTKGMSHTLSKTCTQDVYKHLDNGFSIVGTQIITELDCYIPPGSKGLLFRNSVCMLFKEDKGAPTIVVLPCVCYQTVCEPQFKEQNTDVVEDFIARHNDGVTNWIEKNIMMALALTKAKHIVKEIKKR